MVRSIFALTFLAALAGGPSLSLHASDLSNEAKEASPDADAISKIYRPAQVVPFPVDDDRASPSRGTVSVEEGESRRHDPTICDAVIAENQPQVTVARIAGWFGTPKKEYETTDAYLKRTAKWLGDGKIVASKPIGPGAYDADKQELNVSVFMTMPVKDEKGNGFYEFLPISDIKKSLGSFVGQNAYGVKAHVRSYIETQFGVAWDTSSFNLNSDTSATFSVTAVDAPRVRKHLRFLIAGEAAPPYTFRGVGGHSAYITNPVDLTIFSYAIVAKPTCAAIYDASSKTVLSSWLVK